MVSMQGRVCLVTGASSGIGKATARELARMGASLYLVARDRSRGEAALAEIRRATGNDRLELLQADLASQASIRALAGEVKRRVPALHVLVNNAGALHMERALSPDGIELTLAVNHLGYFLLTSLLLDGLRANAPARVVSVASAAHQGASLDFGDLQNERGYSGWRAYARSKLANILFTRELARRLEGSGVTANCLHPGVVATGLWRNNAGWLGRAVKLAAPLLVSPEKGARTSVYLASSPEVEKVSGGYFAKSRPAHPSPAAEDDEAARRLWELSERLTGLG